MSLKNGIIKCNYVYLDSVFYLIRDKQSPCRINLSRNADTLQNFPATKCRLAGTHTNSGSFFISSNVSFFVSKEAS